MRAWGIGIMKSIFNFVLVSCIGLVLGHSVAMGQEGAPLHPLEPSDTSSPRATLRSFIDSCNELYDLAKTDEKTADLTSKFLPSGQRILDCLDLSALPIELRDSIGVETAVYLKEVLDRIELPPDKEIPDAAAIETASKSEEFSRWQIPHTRLVIVRVQKGPHQGAYLFSSDTVRQAAKFYTAAKHLPYRREGPKVSQEFYDIYVSFTKRQPALLADTSSPRGTLTLFLNSTNELFEVIRKQKHLDRSDPEHLPKIMRILSCLDLSALPEFSRDSYAAEAAVCLKEVLDRTALPSPEGIPGAENIGATGGSETLLRWQIPKTQITIARVQEGPRRGEYLFTPGTVKRAVELYEKAKKLPYRTEGLAVSNGFHDWWLATPGNPLVAAWVDSLPDWFRDRVFGLAVWQWLGLLLAITVGFGVMFVVYRIGRIRSEKMREYSLLRYWVTLVFPIVGMLVPLAFKHVVWEYLTIRGNALYVANFSADLVFLLALIAVILGGSSRIADSFVALPSIRPQGLDAHLIRILCRVLGIVAAVIVFLEGGRYLGFPLTTLLASAGIGGLAIALSAQGMIKGLFGTVTLLLDKPFRVGERIVVKGQDGFVEEIGLRSTKIRTLANHLVSIPNDQIADSEVENIGRRKHIRRMSDLHIPLDTPREKVEKAVAVIRAALDNHEGMDPEFPPRVYFNEFNADSFNIRVICWFQPPNFWDYYAFSEKLNLEIFRAFEEHGIQFSLPLRHTYWKHDDEQGPLDINVVSDGKAQKSDSAK